MTTLRPAATLLVLAALVALPAATPLTAQEPHAPEVLTVEDYARAERALGRHAESLVDGVPGDVSWLADGRATYRVSTPEGGEFVVVDPENGTRAPAFDHDRLAQALGQATGRELEGADLPFSSFQMSEDGRRIALELPPADAASQSAVYTCDLTSNACSEMASRREPPEHSVVSPDGARAAFIRDHDLWVVELETGEETRLTTDGVEGYGYATDNAGWTHSENPVVSWSPDSRKLATFRHDARGVGDMVLATTNVGRPEVERWPYPVPGDSVVFRIERLVVDLGEEGDQPEVVRFDMEPDVHRSMVSDHVRCGTGLCDLLWYPDGSRLAFVSSSRDHKEAWVRVADAETGQVRTLFHETSETQIGDAGAGENWYVLPETDELIWWSERDNWVHLYLYDLVTGELKNRITTGDGNVVELVRVDEEERTIYFTGQGKEDGRDPYFEHLYRIRFDGSGEELLTPEDAHHEISMAPDGAHFIDSWSTPDAPPTTVLRRADGELVRTLEEADMSRLLATGWRPPTPITMKGRDGVTDIHGLMFTPSSMDSTRSYPIVDYIYPGPQSGSVRGRAFSTNRRDHQALAELGFVVVAIDGMGTPGRSKAFHDTYYGDMGDNTLPDQVAGIRQLAERHDWIDLDRVGMWGHSGGGFATAAALFRYPDFFTVGISESGNHDNRNYEDDWGERYQGLLREDPSGEGDNYDEAANQNFARNLQGKLLLAHGGMDDNVPPYNTYLVVEALVEANKDFDLLVLPNARHGYGEWSDYMMRRRWDYFVEHLLGATPPEEYEIGAARRLIP